jgi:hypothetical protein
VLREAVARQLRGARAAEEQQLMDAARDAIERRGMRLLAGEADVGAHADDGKSPPSPPPHGCPACRCGCRRGWCSWAGSTSDARLTGGGWRQRVEALEQIWSRYLSYTVSADKYSPKWGAAEHTVLAQLASDPSLSWGQRASRRAQLVPGAPRAVAPPN